MASVVAGLGIAVYGVSPSSGGIDIFGSPAHAQTNNVVSSATQGFADVVERVKPSVISVKVTMKERARDAANRSDDDEAGSPMERFFRQFGGPDGLPQSPGRGGRHGEVMGQGSGFFISSDGFAVTNNHVVDGADKVEVTTDAGKTYTARVIGTDPRSDVALIKVEGGADFPFVKLSEGKARIGDWVLAVGNPFGLGGTVTAGIVSASGRDIGSGPYDDFIQIDAPVNKGNSGGPAFNMQGEVVGVTAQIDSSSGGNEGVGFAIPSNTVHSVVPQLISTGKAQHAYLGISLDSTANNALVAGVKSNTPAAKAGLKTGDVITSLGSAQTTTPDQLASAIAAHKPGDRVTVTYQRGGQSHTVTLTLASRPS